VTNRGFTLYLANDQNTHPCILDRWAKRGSEVGDLEMLRAIADNTSSFNKTLEFLRGSPQPEIMEAASKSLRRKNTAVLYIIHMGINRFPSEYHINEFLRGRLKKATVDDAQLELPFENSPTQLELHDVQPRLFYDVKIKTGR
jgi:hypothetical protein